MIQFHTTIKSTDAQWVRNLEQVTSPILSLPQ